MSCHVMSYLLETLINHEVEIHFQSHALKYEFIYDSSQSVCGCRIIEFGTYLPLITFIYYKAVVGM